MTKPLSRKHQDEYESDGGFVEDAPKSKKRKSEVSKRKSSESGVVPKDEEGNEYWELSGKRRVQISEFKGATMISIREFYEKDGKMLPGKKGITLSTDQYKALVELLPDIESVLSARNITVPRPQYDGAACKPTPAVEAEQIEAEMGEQEEEMEQSLKKSSGKLEKYKMRKNHEATSDEDDG